MPTLAIWVRMQPDVVASLLSLVRFEQYISNKIETGEGEKLKRKKKKCCYGQPGQADEHGNVGILSQNGCWKAKMSNKKLLKSDLRF